MLSPFAINRLLKHFDAIDQAVSALMLFPRSKDEEQLTGHLVDCFDATLEKQTGLAYRASQLAADLGNAHEPLSVQCNIEVHKYSKTYENRVSQADLGLIIRYENNYEPKESTSKAWLLQAKRIYPSTVNPLSFGVNAKFGAVNTDQEERIHRLVHSLNTDFFRYILYCPRPDENMPKEVRETLSYLRSKQLSDDIFDFARGLALWEDIKNGSPTLAAGVFVAQIDPKPTSLGAVHREIFDSSTPLSWFLIQSLMPYRYKPVRPGDSFHDQIVEKIVTGDESVAAEIATHLNDKDWSGELLPPATLTIKISVGPPNGMDLLPKAAGNVRP